MDTARLERNVDIYMKSMLKTKEAATMTTTMKVKIKKSITRQKNIDSNMLKKEMMMKKKKWRKWFMLALLKKGQFPSSKRV